MTRRASHQGRFALVLALTVLFVGLVESTSREEDASSGRVRRHIGVLDGASTEGKRPTNAADGRAFKTSASKSNEIDAEAGRKVSSSLIGGHLRVNGKEEDEKTEGMLSSSAGNGKETKNSRGDDNDEERKTLSQQVKEGKYGLIQNEIYEEKPRRPGIISYLGNPEVPKDTVENLGGLDEDEIWLAENHVLVLRGGNFPSRGSSDDHEHKGGEEGREEWPPIDNYQAPRRQVKIPTKPKVPPPFPVQLKDGGPVQIIGLNGTKEIENGTLDRTMDPFYGKGVLPGDAPFFTVTSNGTIIVPDFDYPVNVTTDDVTGPGVTSDDDKKTKSEEPPTFYHAIPPGAVFVPPPSNRSDYDDEDQSIYYPPPYSFYYPQDNTTAVPPGPLVPGIILPPPPDFFSPLEEKKSTVKKYTKRPNNYASSVLPKSRPTYLPPRKLTTKQRESTTVKPKISTTQLPRTRTYVRPMVRNLTGTTVPKIRPSTVPYVEVTTLTPDKPSTLRNTKYYTVDPFVGNGVTESNTEDKVQTWSRSTNAKSLPVLTFYSSTTSSGIEEPVEVTPAAIKNVITTDRPGQPPNRASYYFYEESNDGNIATTVESSPVYYQTTTESPYYKVEPLSQQPRNEKPYYSVESTEPKDASRDYNVKLIDALVENPQVYRYSGSEDTSSSSKYDTTADRIQSERMLADQTPVYYQTITARPPVMLQSYYTTPKPPTYYKEPAERSEVKNRQNIRPKPIYQYSFEAADYSKRGQDRTYYKEQDDRLTYNYQTIKPDNQRYDYENDRRQTERTNSVPYKLQRPIYPSTTERPTVNVTPNPQQSYFTRQEERLLDDVTKEYFTIFGKKLSSKDTPSTTPIYNKASHVTEKPSYVDTYAPSDYNVQPETTYRDQVYYNQEVPPPNLESDTRVNYRQPLPSINPDSEFIEVFDPKQRGQQYVQQPVSLHDDILVNYRNPRPPINPDAEFIQPINVPGQNVNPEKSSAYFAYRLPGDGGHFYFLTPQAVSSRQEDQNGGNDGGYFYPKPRGPKLLRRRRNHGNV